MDLVPTSVGTSAMRALHQVSSPISPRACCVLRGTHIAYGAAVRCSARVRAERDYGEWSTTPRAEVCCYAMSGTDVACADSALCGSGTDIAPAAARVNNVPIGPMICNTIQVSISLRARYAMSGTDIAYVLLGATASADAAVPLRRRDPG
eukprot:2436590-Rhodomonas_salina.3